MYGSPLVGGRHSRPRRRFALGLRRPPVDGKSMDSLGIALSGMQSAQTRVGVSAHNLSNLLTEDFRPQRSVQRSLPSGGSRAVVVQTEAAEPVSLVREVVGQQLAGVQYTASARVFAAGAEMRGQLLDILA